MQLLLCGSTGQNSSAWTVWCVCVALLQPCANLQGARPHTGVRALLRPHSPHSHVSLGRSRNKTSITALRFLWPLLMRLHGLAHAAGMNGLRSFLSLRSPRAHNKTLCCDWVCCASRGAIHTRASRPVLSGVAARQALKTSGIDLALCHTQTQTQACPPPPHPHTCTALLRHNDRCMHMTTHPRVQQCRCAHKRVSST